MAEIKDLASYCLSCPKPRCETGCPTGNHIRDFIKALKEDDLDAAAEILYAVNPFPEFTSRLCDCARQCQGHCIRGIKGEPVSIQSIERYISDNRKRQIKVGAPNGKSIAFIGAGIANLSACVRLLEKGYSCEFFEKEASVGGAILTGIPSYRFDKKYLSAIQEELLACGVKFHFGVKVGVDIALQEIVDSHDAVLSSIGAQVENNVGLSAKEGLAAGLSLLYDLNVLNKKEEYKAKYRKAIVWGGGNVAMDCARSLIRILDDVTIVYRRSKVEMPASALEVAEAEQEGVKIAFLNNITSLVLDENEKVKGANCIKMELGEKDESGRASCHAVSGSDFFLEADLIVPAIGQKVDLAAISPNLENNKETHRTALDKVYLSGDCHLGPKTVAACIHDGIAAAKEIEEDLAK